MSDNLGLETVKSIGEGIKVRLGTPFDSGNESLVGVWHEELSTAGMTESNAKEMVHGFANFWTSRRRDHIARLSHLCRYVKEHRPRKEHLIPPPEGRCRYCNETGWFPLALPESGARYPHLTAKEYSFCPGAVWDKSRVWERAVPCVCPAGQRKEKAGNPLSEDWKRLRDEFKTWYDGDRHGIASLSRFISQCLQAHRARRDREMQEWQKQKAQKRTEQVADVPDSEIPF